MLIRSTTKACFVILRNGLMLELIYAATLTGKHTRAEPKPAQARESSHGVWLMGEAVLCEVHAGQA